MPPCRFVNCLDRERGPREWTPPEPVPELIDTWYFGRALAAMERELRTGPLTVYLTFDPESLPSYGDDVVVVLIGDEWARVPAYLPRVRAVFRNLCSRPNLGASPLAWPSAVDPRVAAARRARAAAAGRPRRRGCGLLRARRAARAPGRAPDRAPTTCWTCRCVPFAERRSDLFFAGSVGHAPGRGGRAEGPRDAQGPLPEGDAAQRGSAPRSGRAWSVDVRITDSFQQSASADAGEYSRALMDSRLALVPRGATTETHRFFQALKYGCVVVTDAVPPIWFYEQAPIVRLRHWDELERAVVPLLGSARAAGEPAPPVAALVARPPARRRRWGGSWPRRSTRRLSIASRRSPRAGRPRGAQA